MKEIEIKAHLKDKQSVISKLKELGCTVSEPIRQIDTVYTKIIGNVEKYLENDHFVRIREKSDGKYLFTIKVPKSKKGDLIKTEHETEISNPQEMESILFIMDYQVSNKVIKVRNTTKYEDYEICLDEVEELGSFIEVEKMVNNDPMNDQIVLSEIKSFLESLGVLAQDAINKGYDIMMVEKTSAKP